MFRFPKRWLVSRLKRTVLLLSLISAIFVVVSSIFLLIFHNDISSFIHRAPSANGSKGSRPIVQFYPDNQNKYLFRKSEDGLPNENVIVKEVPNNEDGKYEEALKNLVNPSVLDSEVVISDGSVSNDVHVFYYAWYGSPEFDGQWWHWNHRYLPDWNKNRQIKDLPTGSHEPPDDIGAGFYPELGPYSSKDPEIIRQHMIQIRRSGCGVLVVSWYPPGQADENGPPSDDKIPLLLDAANEHGLKIALHVEPFKNITPETFRQHLRYVRDKYFEHPAFYKRKVGNRLLPMYYIYDSYRVVPEQWNRLFGTKGNLTIRGTDLDGVFLGLLVELKHRVDIKRAKFDGFYTYFAANGFTYGSTWKNWKGLASFARQNSLLFVPSVGPGYDDTRIRAWNGQTTRYRRNGVYYSLSWRTAIGAPARVVSVTSFNEWHEGTQIEAAVPKVQEGYSYLSYEPNSPTFYLDETAKWIRAFKNKTIHV